MSDERLHLIMGWTFGFSLLTAIAVLGGMVAIGKVEMQTSYGLPTLFGCLATLSGGFAQWAFTKKRSLYLENEIKQLKVLVMQMQAKAA